jgi:hypothetical protein
MHKRSVIVAALLVAGFAFGGPLVAPVLGQNAPPAQSSGAAPRTFPVALG